MIGRNAPTVESEPTKLKGFDDFDLRLGDTMRGERATMGKSLLDVQRELKVKATYIAAIENCDPSAFDTPGFIAGYVRSYARYLGMNPDQAFSDFCSESDFRTADGMSAGASAPKAQRATRKIGQDPFGDPNATFIPRGEAFSTHIDFGAIASVVVLLGLIGAIGFGGWTVLQEVQRVEFTPAEDAPITTASIDPLSAATSGVAGTPTGTDQLRAEALDRLYRPEALDIPVLEPRDGPIASVDPRVFGALAAPVREEPVIIASAGQRILDDGVANTQPDDIQVVAASAPELVLVAVRPAWVRVQGAGGTVLLEKVLDAGEEFVLPQTEEPPVLRVGESGAVYFAVNGEHYGPAGPEGVVTKDIALAAESLKQAYEVADLSQDQDLARMVAEAQTAVVEEAPAE